MTYTIIAKSNLNAHPHTWTKGFDYQVVQKEGYFILASNEGSINYLNEVKEHVLKEFEVKSSRQILKDNGYDESILSTMSDEDCDNEIQEIPYNI